MWICPECRSIYRDAVTRCDRDGAPVAEVHAHQNKARYPLLGKVVGDRYHLIGGLGQGGLGTVYLAQHLHLGQLFAVKFLDLDSLGHDAEEGQKDDYRRDFLKEARVASLIRHDAVVRVTDFGEHDGLPFLVMEYVPGPSLLHVLASKGRFDVPEAINIARRIAEALDAFHDRRLVHRDVKPANVILDPRGDGRLTLVDLGLVKDLSGPGGKASTHPMALRGTPGYLAPEQVPAWVLAGAGVKTVAEKQPVDARVDIYALGVIFYECLAGVSPYPDGSNTAIIVYACTHDPVPLSTVHPPVKLRPELSALIEDTMARDPSRRPQSAADFLERLDAVTQGVNSQPSWPAPVISGQPERAPDFTPPGALGPVVIEGGYSLDGSTSVFDVLDGVPDPEAAPVVRVPSRGPAAAAELPVPRVETGAKLRGPTIETGPRLRDRVSADLDDDVTEAGHLEPGALNEALARRTAAHPVTPAKSRSLPIVLGGALLLLAGSVGAWVATRPTDEVPEAAEVVTIRADEPKALPLPIPIEAEPLKPVEKDAGVAAPKPEPVKPEPVKPKPPTRPKTDNAAGVLAKAETAYHDRDFPEALRLYREFCNRAGESHPEYSVAKSRIKVLEGLVGSP